MDGFKDIKEIWAAAPAASLPEAGAAVRMIRDYRHRQLFKALGIIVASVLLMGLMGWVISDYHSQMASTRAGEVLMMMAMLILLGAGITNARRTATLGDYSNGAFLQYLKQERLRMAAFKRGTQVAGLSFASLGLMLYIYEMALQTGNIILWYSVLLIFLVICWFVIRPRAAKRKEQQLNRQINQLEQLSAQLSDKAIQ